MRKGRNNGLAVAKQKDNNYFTEIYYIPSDFDVLLITKQRLILLIVCIIYRLVERLSIKTSTKESGTLAIQSSAFYMYLLIKITFG